MTTADPAPRPAVAERAAWSLNGSREALAQAVTDRLYAEMPELTERHGERGRLKCLQDMRYNLEHLAPSVEMEDPEGFAGYVLWLDDLLSARNVATTEVVRCLEITRRVVAERMPPEEAEAVDRSLQAGLAALRARGA